MKKLVLFCSILFTSLASAADLYVREDGSGGSYTTITAAMNAAVDGDKIIIQPKAGNQPYIEDLTINKSLSFVSETYFVKYLVQGSILITTLPGRVITINGLSITSNIQVYNTIDGRTTVNILNSDLNGVFGAQENISVNMSGCTASGVSISHGKITGNTITDYMDISTNTVDSNAATDDVEIIANNFTGFCQLGVFSKSYACKILNNFFVNGYITVHTLKDNSMNEIRNNVLRGVFGSTEPFYSINIQYYNTAINATVVIVNNIIEKTGDLDLGGTYYPIGNSSDAGAITATVYASYNMSNVSFVNNGPIISSNNSMGSFALDIASASVSGSNINAGIPEDDYADLDLSRNDIGNYGGSDSWANYWPTAVNKPQVNYLKTPRRVSTGITEINAIGAADSSASLSQAEYFWDTDPGEGNATAFSAADGTLDNAYENLSQDGISIVNPVGLHTFNVRVKDDTGAWGPVFKNIVYIETVLGNESVAASKGMAYSNPVKDVLNISMDSEINNVSIYNLTGQVVISKSINANEGSIDISNLASGTYLVKLLTSNTIKTLKVVKE